MWKAVEGKWRRSTTRLRLGIPRMTRKHVLPKSHACDNGSVHGAHRGTVEREIRKTNLLGKPVAQECVVRAFVRLTGAPTNMSAEDACNRLNHLPWNMTEENLQKWQRVLWNGGKDGKIITKNRKLAIGLMAWAADGERLHRQEAGRIADGIPQAVSGRGTGPGVAGIVLSRRQIDKSGRRPA